MVLYHISRNLNHNGFFFPDIPKHILQNENQTIPRVCTSTTLEGCLGAMPDGGFNLRNTVTEKTNQFKCFRIDTEKLKLEMILTNQELYDNQYVMDALLSKEHWILEQFLVPEEDTFLIEIESFDTYPYGYENKQFFEDVEKSGLTLKEFYASDLYDPNEHTEDYIVVYNLQYKEVSITPQTIPA